jgi:hypothetical protein
MMNQTPALGTLDGGCAIAYPPYILAAVASKLP